MNNEKKLLEFFMGTENADHQFCDSCSRESQRVLTSVLIKATTAS